MRVADGRLAAKSEPRAGSPRLSSVSLCIFSILPPNTERSQRDYGTRFNVDCPSQRRKLPLMTGTVAQMRCVGGRATTHLEASRHGLTRMTTQPLLVEFSVGLASPRSSIGNTCAGMAIALEC